MARLELNAQDLAAAMERTFELVREFWRSLPHRSEVASTLGRLILGPDTFHDGRIFDPSLGDLPA